MSACDDFDLNVRFTSYSRGRSYRRYDDCNDRRRGWGFRFYNGRNRGRYQQARWGYGNHTCRCC